MDTNVFIKTTSTITDEVSNVEKSNLDAKRFYDMLDDANQPIYSVIEKVYLNFL